MANGFVLWSTQMWFQECPFWILVVKISQPKNVRSIRDQLYSFPQPGPWMVVLVMIIYGSKHLFGLRIWNAYSQEILEQPERMNLMKWRWNNISLLTRHIVPRDVHFFPLPIQYLVPKIVIQWISILNSWLIFKYS